MRVLVTGSSGYLGRTLVPRLQQHGDTVVGLDPVPSETTNLLGSVTDLSVLHRAIREYEIEAIVHAGALHKPDIAARSNGDFIAANVQGTLNLLEEAVAPGAKVARLVFTSTTSLMISQELSAGRSQSPRRAAWITESHQPLLPRNIYGVTKLAAEHLCRMFHQTHGLPVVILRTSRFFPEEDDMAHAIKQSGPNTKANELLFRRLTVEDAAECHLVALNKAPEIGFDTFIVSAKTPFCEDDCEQLMIDAPSVVAQYFPQYTRIYEGLGWTMFDTIDRVYVAEKLERKLGFVARTGFGERLNELAAQLG
jgi:UDP-glucose 4-epimerase